MPLLTVEQLQDLAPALRSRVGTSAAKLLLKWSKVDILNDLYDKICGHRGPDFASTLLDELKVKPTILHEERLKELPEGPFITVSNHPYGSIDGIILSDIFGHLREGYKVMVNEFLMRIEALTPSLISVTPRTKLSNGVSTTSINGIKQVLQNLKEGHPVGFFPAGAVSDLKLKERCIKDREWQDSVIRIIQKAKVPVVPVHFLDGNSATYYNLGLINWKIRILRLPAELLNKAGKLTRVAIGPVISVEEQSSHESLKDLSDFLRASVYNLE